MKLLKIVGLVRSILVIAMLYSNAVVNFCLNLLFVFSQAGSNSPILLSNVRCDPLDTDITNCRGGLRWRSEKPDMFLNSCDHPDDVGIRCYDVSWAGIRLGKTSTKNALTVESINICYLEDLYTIKVSLISLSSQV